MQIKLKSAKDYVCQERMHNNVRSQIDPIEEHNYQIKGKYKRNCSGTSKRKQ